MKSNKSKLKNEIIYQIDVRNHTKEGTFTALIDDIPRLKQLGITIIYLMPIHPIGKLMRKGNYGSPYSIMDYYAINEDMGTLDDFIRLINIVHHQEIKIIIDIVFNHTSKDAPLIERHPEFYYLNSEGKPTNRIEDWSDVADLNFSNNELHDYLIEVLVYWLKKGVDGFRCDVAPLIPLSFWLKARKECDKFNHNSIWLAESVESGFIKYLRSINRDAYTDCQMYQAFDILYDYDVFPYLKSYLINSGDLNEYLKEVRRQEFIYPSDYLKLHFLENHDQPRIAAMVKDDLVLRNLTAWSYFQNGLVLISAGQELKHKIRPSLLEKDYIDKTIIDEPFYEFTKRLILLKKHQRFSEVVTFDINEHLQLNLIEAKMKTDKETIYGLFNISRYRRQIYVPLKEGVYYDLISEKDIEVRNGIIQIDEPLFLVVES
jgi:cyclomaltodextrinase / maltogenic alpha-amylase / neopullulanase